MASQKSCNRTAVGTLPEIETGKLRVLFGDECHLMGGDIEGYVWERKNERVEVDGEPRTTIANHCETSLAASQ